MKHDTKDSRFDERETDQLIANFSNKMSPEEYLFEGSDLTREQREFLAWVAEERIRDDWEELQKRDWEREANGQQKSHQKSL